MSEQFVTTTKHFRKLLATGYLLIVLLGAASSARGSANGATWSCWNGRTVKSTASARKHTMRMWVWWSCLFWASRCWNGTIRMWRHTGGNG